ncbi:hypothetical protein Tco_1288815 [Tanacetum coccineum]
MEVHLLRLWAIQKGSRPGISRLTMSSQKPSVCLNYLFGTTIVVQGKRKLETLGSDFEHRNINTELQLGNMNNGVPFCDAQLLDESCGFYGVHDVGGVCPVGSGSVGSMTILDFGNSEVHSVSGQKTGGLFSLGSNIGGGQMVLDFKNSVSHFPCDENHFNKVDGFNDGAWFGLNIATHLFLMIRTTVSFGNMEVFGLKGSPPQAVLVGNEEVQKLVPHPI